MVLLEWGESRGQDRGHTGRSFADGMPGGAEVEENRTSLIGEIDVLQLQVPVQHALVVHGP